MCTHPTSSPSGTPHQHRLMAILLFPMPWLCLQACNPMPRRCVLLCWIAQLTLAHMLHAFHHSAMRLCSSCTTAVLWMHAAFLKIPACASRMLCLIRSAPHLDMKQMCPVCAIVVEFVLVMVPHALHLNMVTLHSLAMAVWSHSMASLSISLVPLNIACPSALYLDISMTSTLRWASVWQAIHHKDACRRGHCRFLDMTR